MRKRSSYRPKPLMVDPLRYVLESFKPIHAHDSYLVDMKIKNHGAMSNLTKGLASKDDVNTLINMVNTAEALYRLGFGREYGEVVKDGLDALHDVGARGVESNRFILKAHEMSHLNTIMELHDAQMDLITIKDMESAIEMIEQNFKQRKMRPIVEKKS